MKFTNEAVSPVIGVLLMLTLTLIVAAIVNSYAGGLMETESKSPSVTIQAEYHQSGDMELRHISGDPIPTSSVTCIIRPTDTMGRTAGQRLSVIQAQYLKNDEEGKSWSSGITVMRPGDVHRVLNSDLPNLQAGIEQEYWINRTANLGKTFYLEMYYKNTMISRSEVLIEV